MIKIRNLAVFNKGYKSIPKEIIKNFFLLNMRGIGPDLFVISSFIFIRDDVPINTELQHGYISKPNEKRSKEDTERIRLSQRTLESELARYATEAYAYIDGRPNRIYQKRCDDISLIYACSDIGVFGCA